MRHLAIALCLLATPSAALELTTTSTLTPCGAQMCLDMRWSLYAEDLAGEVTLSLPSPGSHWEMTSGSLNLRAT